MPEITSEPALRLAGCVIYDHRARILLLYRDTERRRHWEIPGGRIEPGERPPEAAVREVREELDLTVAIDREIGTGQFVEDETAMSYTWFEAHVIHGVPRVREPQIHDRYGYFTLEQLRGLEEVSSSIKALLAEADAGRIQLDPT